MEISGKMQRFSDLGDGDGGSTDAVRKRMNEFFGGVDACPHAGVRPPGQRRDSVR